MKWFYIPVLLGILFASNPWIVAQEADDALSNVLAIQQEETVYLRWTIRAGNTCDGTRIERSEDGIFFTEIGDIPGVCGSPDQSITYDFRDTLPGLNRVNHYRLQLGLLGYSSPLSVEVVVLNEEGYNVMPNPVAGRSVFRFGNPDQELHEFCLIDTRGVVIYNTQTSGDRIDIYGEMIPAGTYIFKLRQGNELKARGKIVVI